MVQRSMTRWTRRTALAAMGAALATGRAVAAAPADADPWPALAAQIFRGHALQDGADVVAIDAPYRAEDAAIVPVTIRTLLPPHDQRRVERLTLVIDQNPSPLVAAFTIGAGSGVNRIATHVRVNDYTDMHVVAALSDGRLYVTKRYVKAAGGCSAPAMKQEHDPIPLGTMRFRQFPAGTDGTSAGLREAQLMIRHPNYSGLQMDQVTRLYIPARFVKALKLWQGDALLFGMEGGISISENPQFRFTYRPNGAKSFRAEAEDTKGLVFKGEWPVASV